MSFSEIVAYIVAILIGTGIVFVLLPVEFPGTAFVRNTILMTRTPSLRLRKSIEMATLSGSLTLKSLNWN
jgi:hypothetical protein